MENLQLNAIGVIIRGTIVEDGVAVDVSTVSTQQIVLRKPNGAVLTKTSVFTTNGTDGKIQYLTVAGDLDVDGLWEAQGYVVFPGGFNGRSDVKEFLVNPNL